MGFCTVHCKVIVFFLTFVILKPEPMKQSLFFSIAASLLLLAGCSGNQAAAPQDIGLSDGLMNTRKK